MIANATYKAKQFNLSGLNGISDETLEMHFKLYEGYVTNTNTYNERIAAIVGSGKVSTEDVPAFSELKRRVSFEYNGMVLHEYYFGNMKQGGNINPDKSSKFYKAAEKTFGSYDVWKADFVGVGNMRGVGWAICYEDPRSGVLSNIWVEEHQNGNIAGFSPTLVMDVWEHAFLLDYKPAERPKYIEAFFSNIDWTAVDNRVRGSSQGTAA
jgi:Fe-Mn family superoxide dismutase